jgi:hypothetical protein
MGTKQAQEAFRYVYNLIGNADKAAEIVHEISTIATGAERETMDARYGDEFVTTVMGMVGNCTRYDD